MDSRTQILEKVRKNKPTLESHIDIEQFEETIDEGLVEKYKLSLEANGGSCIDLSNSSELENILTKEVEGQSFVDLTNSLSEITGKDISSLEHPKELAEVKVLIAKGKVGVSENAAIWMDEEALSAVRVLPFIVERSIFIIEKANLVATMHQAYQKIGALNTGFGSFIAGPSKTADIEQNLVIGAHGTKSHLVILV
ncbi:MAG: LUD domain-containing protein [Cyclobacteriaceae bacterium]